MFRFFGWWFGFLTPRFWPVVAAGVAAVGSLLASRMGNSAQDDRQAQSQDFNREEAALARQFNAEQADVARDWSAEQAYIDRYYNAEQANIARTFSAGQSQAQMDFQERMSNTQYQRATADMRAAGINPLLAYSQGGAGTPVGSAASATSASSSHGSGPSASGPAASSPTPQQVQRYELGAALSTAVGLAQVDKIEAEAENIRADTKLKSADVIDDDEGRDYPKTYSALERQQRSLLLARQMRTEVERGDLTREETDLVREQIKNAVKEGRRIEATTRSENANAVLRELARNEAASTSQFYGEHPQAGGFAAGAKILGEGVGSALGLKRLLGR